ncbi:hypothetical protein F7725_013804 [Dissostichus mawsoni]|uniref:Uncharacterized protein n=1 Tax=Dissostichus mawsoni TaxID=36200 RepID=A0A7J5YUJ0_DISMA|nr:hypothetical protein F7725_013804 [Dissostichus mawsoni]
MLPVEIQSLEGALGQREAAGGERAGEHQRPQGAFLCFKTDLRDGRRLETRNRQKIRRSARESLDVKRTGALPPLVLNSIQRHFHWWDGERKQEFCDMCFSTDADLL